MGNERTPGPYYMVHSERGQVFYICRRWDDKVKVSDCTTFGSSYGAHIADIFYNSGIPTLEQARANAAFIVQACNAHDALVAATTKMLAAWDGYEMLAALDYKVREAVEAAIALATEATDDTD